MREYNLQPKTRQATGEQRAAGVQHLGATQGAAQGDTYSKGAKGSGKRPAQGEPAGQPKMKKAAKKCFKCGQTGHMQAQCTE